MKPILQISLKIFVSTFLLWLLVHTSTLDIGLFKYLFASPLWFTITAALYLIVIAISTWRWQTLNAAQDIKLTYSQTLLPTYLGIAFNNLLPGGVGGDFFRFYFLYKKTTVKKSNVTISILFDRLCGLSGIFLLVAAISGFYFSRFHAIHLLFYFTILCLVFCSLLAMLFLARRMLTQLFPIRKILAPLAGLLDAILTYRHAKMTIVAGLLTSVMIQALIALTCMMIGKMMGFPVISFGDYAIAVAITQIVNLIPIAPGGLGVGEMAFANVLALLNPTISISCATIFLAYRFIGFLLYLPGLLVFVLDRSLLKRRLAVSET